MAMEYEWAGPVAEGGRWLRSLRVGRGKTLAEVDKATGVSQQNISNLENGQIGKPAMPMLARLAEYYGVTPTEVARRFGWWHGVDDEQSKDPRLVYLEQVLARLNPGQRYNLLQQVKGLAQLAEQEAKK